MLAYVGSAEDHVADVGGEPDRSRTLVSFPGLPCQAVLERPLWNPNLVEVFGDALARLLLGLLVEEAGARRAMSQEQSRRERSSVGAQANTSV